MADPEDDMTTNNTNNPDNSGKTDPYRLCKLPVRLTLDLVLGVPDGMSDAEALITMYKELQGYLMADTDSALDCFEISDEQVAELAEDGTELSELHDGYAGPFICEKTRLTVDQTDPTHAE